MEEPRDNSAPRTLWTGKTHPFLWKTGVRTRIVRIAAQAFGAAAGPENGPTRGSLPRRRPFHTHRARPAAPDRRDPATAGAVPRSIGRPLLRGGRRSPRKGPACTRTSASGRGPTTRPGNAPGLRKGSRAALARLPYVSSTALPAKVIDRCAWCRRGRSARCRTFVS
ncbi:hypothetical protein Kpho02_09530 [Kitasatospora phosalacinea]|uniref:Uncharacterized protein n=1 Tax=Kitasatospora phosalacinea TaxID=2065 RepID=A0A9W6Q2C8_9ACTN|nr:hypothetical protein Kpho02_09530 [Kitasatospora phosalacinea]